MRDEALRLMLDERGAAVVPVLEGDTSMLPHLRGGDAVLVAPLSGPPRFGDVIVFRQSDYWVVHRCLGSASAGGRAGFRTRGDGRNVLDPLVARADVLARAVAVRRGGRWSSLSGSRARLYAACIAAHDLCWAAAGFAGSKAGLGGLVAACDRGALKLAVSLVFPLFHRTIPTPAVTGPSAPV